MQPKRASAYIDGFNLYHAIDGLRRPHLKWVNLWQLCVDLLRENESLEAVHYFSAYATWKPDAMARHHEYTKALAHVGVTTHMARFKEKPRSCKTCGARWIGHEEKETDVQIALSIVRDTFTDAFDRAILISADSDLGPALRMAKAHSPQKELFVVAPPGRFGSARDLNPKMEITKGRLGKALLPDRAIDAAGTVIFTRPASYDPPPPL